MREPEEFKPTKRESIDLAAPPEKPRPVEEEVVAPEEEKQAYQRAPKHVTEETPDDKELVMGKAEVSTEITCFVVVVGVFWGEGVLNALADTFTCAVLGSLAPLFWVSKPERTTLFAL